MEEKVKQWIVLSSKLKSIKEDEMTLRKEIAEFILEGQEKGTVHGEIGKYKLKAVAKQNKSVDKEGLRSVWKYLNQTEKDAFKFEVKVVESGFKKLQKDSKALEFITTKPGSPSLELEV